MNIFERYAEIVSNRWDPEREPGGAWASVRCKEEVSAEMSACVGFAFDNRCKLQHTGTGWVSQRIIPKKLFKVSQSLRRSGWAVKFDDGRWLMPETNSERLIRELDDRMNAVRKRQMVPIRTEEEEASIRAEVASIGVDIAAQFDKVFPQV